MSAASGLPHGESHHRIQDENLDWTAILLGVRNPQTGQVEGGLIPTVGRLADRMDKLAEQMDRRRITDSYVLRGIALIVMLREFGMPRVEDLLKLIPHAAGGG